MKLKKFKFKTVNSTNDIAIRLIRNTNNKYYESIDDLSGLSKNHPLISLSLLIILFSLA